MVAPGLEDDREPSLPQLRASDSVNQPVDAATWWGRLREEWGLDFRQAERVVDALAAGPLTLPELVRATSLDRRQVQRVLQEMGPLVAATERGMALTAERSAGQQQGIPRGTRRREDLRRKLERVRARLPRDRADLDHVSATVETMATRAEYFADQFDLVDRTVLCVGDHDLTSVAVTLLEPHCRALVVDVDPAVLAVIDAARTELGLAITLAQADLRLGFPPAFSGQADLAFTDPPYTPDGIGLFLCRCIEGLRDTGHERLAFAYGFARSQVARGFQTQEAVHDLKLAYEAILPGFNRFDGAEAIGAASQLYVCRPTRWTRPAARNALTSLTRIYTRGAASTESQAEPVPPDVVTASDLDAVGLGVTGRRSRVGEGWPKELPGSQRVTLERFLEEPAQSERDRRDRTAVVVNLWPHFEPVLPAALLAGLSWADVRVVTSARALEPLTTGPLRQLLTAAADLEVTRVARSFAVVSLRARQQTPDVDDRTRMLSGLASRAHATVRNVWRDQVIDLGRRHGATVTKKEALARIEAAVNDHSFLRLRLVDMAEPDLAQLVRGVEIITDTAGRPSGVATWSAPS